MQLTRGTAAYNTVNHLSETLSNIIKSVTKSNIIKSVTVGLVNQAWSHNGQITRL